MVRSTVDASPPLYQSLSELQDAADRIFDAILSRVGSERQRLNNLSTRIAFAQGKVDAISGTKRATTIYSSAKWPRVDTTPADFVPLFEDTGGHGGSYSANSVSLNVGLWQSREEGTLELFQFFSETSHEYFMKNHEQDGVGKVSPRIESVADLVLFNSMEVPYHKYKVVDNLAGVDQVVADEGLHVKLAALPAAPQSVLAGVDLPRPGAEEYGFRPVLREVPSFSLPSMLPDLPMVAEISWSGTAGGMDQIPSIAPSAVHSGTFSPSANSITSPLQYSSSSRRLDLTSASAKFKPASASEKLDLDTVSTRFDSTSFSGSVQKEDVSSRPLQLLQVNTAEESGILNRGTRSDSKGSNSSSDSLQNLQSLHNISASTRTKVNAERWDSPIPPPPPPPAPIPPQTWQPSPAKVDQVASNSSAQQSLPVIDNQRAALMSSIRSSGINILRKTSRNESPKASPKPSGKPTIGKTEPEVVDNSSSPIVKQPINVMAEMARSLTLRRLSMRGASQSQGGVRIVTSAPEIEEEDHNTGSGDQSKLTLPNLRQSVPQHSDDQSDDDDWEE